MRIKSDIDLKEIAKVLEEDSVVRAGVIKALARDFPKDFLAPVKVDLSRLQDSGGVGSCKEWQE